MKLDQQKQTERAIAKALKEQLPLADLPGVSIENVREEPRQPSSTRAFDLSFTLRSGSNSVQVMAEVKAAVSPRMLMEIAPWIRRLKALRQDISVAVIATVLSPQAQEFCIKNGIDFLDLAGNIFVNVPGKFTIQRSGIRVQGASRDSEGSRTINVFGGRSSRVLRVLLQGARPWTITEIARELEEEGKRSRSRFPRAQGLDFQISLGSISKAVISLEEQLWVRRRRKTISVPEPQRVLELWAEKYKERYRWRLRSSFQTNNPFGSDLPGISEGLRRTAPGAFAFTGAAAASLSAPFVDIDLIDLFIIAGDGDERLRKLKWEPNKGPALRCVYPYDLGVFMYSNRAEGVTVVSAVQTYLDLYARGGRDLKQAEYLLQTTIQRQWAPQ